MTERSRPHALRKIGYVDGAIRVDLDHRPAAGHRHRHLVVPQLLRAALVSEVAFVAATVPITIFANAARVVLTGLIGQQFGVEYASGFFHEFAGLAIYLFAFACLLGLHALVRVVAPRRERGQS